VPFVEYCLVEEDEDEMAKKLGKEMRGNGDKQIHAKKTAENTSFQALRKRKSAAQSANAHDEFANVKGKENKEPNARGQLGSPGRLSLLKGKTTNIIGQPVKKPLKSIPKVRVAVNRRLGMTQKPAHGKDLKELGFMSFDRGHYHTDRVSKVIDLNLNLV
jgi:hypothetical protein